LEIGFDEVDVSGFDQIQRAILRQQLFRKAWRRQAENWPSPASGARSRRKVIAEPLPSIA